MLDFTQSGKRQCFFELLFLKKIEKRIYRCDTVSTKKAIICSFHTFRPFFVTFPTPEFTNV